MSCIVVPDTGLKLVDGSVVILAKYPGTKWILHQGWYTYQGNQYNGWYFCSIPAQVTLPVNDEDLRMLTLVSSDNGGPSCPPGPYPPTPPCPPGPHHPGDFAKELDRAWISVETIAERDYLNTRLLPNGKIVRVNNVMGVPKYYRWNQVTQTWDNETFGIDTTNFMRTEDAEQYIESTVDSILPDKLEPIEKSISELKTSTESEFKKIDEEISAIESDISEIQDSMGNVKPTTTETVSMAKDIISTVDIGNIKRGDLINISETPTLQKFLEKLLTKDSPAEVTQPYITVELENAGPKEVGTVFTPKYTVTLHPGTYSDNIQGKQPTNVSANYFNIYDSNGSHYTVTDRDSTGNSKNELVSSASAVGEFESFTVTETTNYTITATIEYTDGAIPTTYLMNPDPDNQIKSGVVTKVSASVTGYIPGYYGAMEDKSDAIDLELINKLGNKFVPNKEKSLTIPVPAGSLRTVIAIPSGSPSIKSISSAEEGGIEITDSFLVFNVVGSYDFTVYVKDLAVPQNDSTEYTVEF